jgi:hypothetical protein
MTTQFILTAIGCGIGALAAYLIHRLSLLAAKRGWTTSPFDFYGRGLMILLIVCVVLLIVVPRTSHSTDEAGTPVSSSLKTGEISPAPALRPAPVVLLELPETQAADRPIPFGLQSVESGDFFETNKLTSIHTQHPPSH